MFRKADLLHGFCIRYSKNAQNPITMTDLVYIIACYWNLVVPSCKSIGTLFVDKCSERMIKYKLAMPPIEEEVMDNSLAF